MFSGFARYPLCPNFNFQSMTLCQLASLLILVLHLVCPPILLVCLLSRHTLSPPWGFQEWVESCMDHRLVEQWAGWTNHCVLQQEKLYQTMLQRSSLMKMTSWKFVWNVQLSNSRMDDKYAVQHTCSTQFSFRFPCLGCNGATAYPYWMLWPRFAISSVTFSDPQCQAGLTPGFSSVYSRYSYPSEWYSRLSHMRCCPQQQ